MRVRVRACPCAGIAQAQERDVAVGAFVRMMQEAGPLALPPSTPGTEDLTASEALAELSMLVEDIKGALAL